MEVITIHPLQNISERILKHLQRKEYRPRQIRQLARSMGVSAGGYPAFREAIKTLMKQGRVVLGGGNDVLLAQPADTIVGSFRGHPRGFGFVVPNSPTEHGDLFIPPGATLQAMTGDTVAARIVRRGRRGAEVRIEGEITRIIERGQSRFVGELVHEGRQWYLRPDGRVLFASVLLGDVSATGAKAGDQIVVELTEFPTPDRPPRGVIVEVLGRRGDPEIDTLSIIRQYHLPEEFPDAVLDDARRAVREYDLESVLHQREDLRGQVVITIDPDDARDFDDAISLRRIGKNRFELGVHIADVAAFVTEDGPLDTEARQRGNSVYLPRRVIPMLPEVLSNGLCSLQEDQPRLTKSVFIEYDRQGQRVGKRYANTIIQSRQRLTYRQATAIIEGKKKNFAPEVVTLLKDMEQLARLIQRRRLDAGMVVLDLPDIELIFDDRENCIGVQPEDTSFSHTIIEMFMVEANEAVAELFTDLNVPHLRRIHPEPPADGRKKLARLLRVLGKPIPGHLQREDMIRLLDSVRGTDDAFAVHFAVLRSMAQAEYSPKLIGHFALASRHYSHFTSPIRRYPDLTVHRLLDLYLRGKLKSKADRKNVPSMDALTELGRACTFSEQRAEHAERELKMVKILRLLEKNLGAVEDGIVTGVTNVGLFVQLRTYQIEGLVRFADLPDDWWDIDARGGCVVGRMTGRRIAVGNRLKVRIARVNIAARELDLALGEDLTTRQASKRKKTKEKTKTKVTRIYPKRKHK